MINISPWMIELHGDTMDLQDFRETFRDPICQIIEQEGEYFLRSSRFEILQEAWDVDRQARELLPTIISAARVLMGQISPITLGKVVHIEEDGSLKRFVFLQATLSGRGRLRAKAVVTSADGVVIEPGPSLPQQWVNLALKESDIAEALYYFAGDHTWFTLYKIHEIIEHDVGADVVESWQPGMSNTFTLSANNASISGTLARHSREKFKKPSKSKGMTLPEAVQYIHTILRRWLDTKI